VNEQYRKPYVDSSVFIAWLKGESASNINRKEIFDHILTLAKGKAFKIYTSAFTLVEVHKRRRGPCLSTEEDEKILGFFEHEYIYLVDLDRGIAEHANRLCREYGLGPADAVHLASALRAGCDILLTWDKDFHAVIHPEIVIEPPRKLGQLILPVIEG